MMKDSDRYKLIRTRFMTQIFSDISNNLDGISLADNDIFRMFEEKIKVISKARQK